MYTTIQKHLPVGEASLMFLGQHLMVVLLKVHRENLHPEKNRCHSLVHPLLQTENYSKITKLDLIFEVTFHNVARNCLKIK